jgi:acyl carrier protein
MSYKGNLAEIELHNKEKPESTYSTVENKLIDIMRRLLPIEGASLGLEDDFFDLGADSMIVIELISAAREHGLKFGMSEVYEYRTIAALANNLCSKILKDLDEDLSHDEVSTAFSLLPNQSAYCFTESMTIATYLIRPTFHLDKERLEYALQLLIQRHDALRISFIQREREWQQIVNSYIATPHIEYVKLDNTINDLQRDKVIYDCSLKLIQSMNVEDKHVQYRAALFESSNQQLFFFAIDHYSFDELSMKLFWNELHSAYVGKTLLSIDISYSRVVEALYDIANTWNFREDELFWMKQHSQIVHLPKSVNESLPVDYCIKAKTLILEGEDWLNKFLLNVASHAGVQLHEVLLASWLHALSLISGLIGFTMILGSHNRKLLDGMLHTMGCFVTGYPLYLEAPHVGDVRGAIENVRDQLELAPHKGMRYMLSMMINQTWKETIYSAPQPSLGFNYLGDEEVNQEMWEGTKDNEFKGKLVSIRKGELLSGRHQAANSIPYLIIHCQVNTKLKNITLTCDYESGHYGEFFIEQLMQTYKRIIQNYALQLLN